MRRVVLVAPGDLATRTGGYIYDRRIVQGLRELGWDVDVRDDLAGAPDGAIALVDGLTWVAAGAGLERHQHRLRIVPLVHLSLALEVGLEPDEAARRGAIEARALAAAPLIVATGAFTVEYLSSRGIERKRIALVEPGTERAPIARGSGGPLVALATVGALTPGKGHEVLIRSLAAVRSRCWSLTCAGSLNRDRRTADRVRGLIADFGLAGCVTLAGELDEHQLDALYDRSDAFVLPTLRETFGMAVAEAVAHGLPVVSTTVGAIPQIVGEGGLLVAPGDEPALASALTRAIEDGDLRSTLARGACTARQRLRTWKDASAAMAAALAPLSTA